MATTIRLEITDGFNPIMDKLKDISRGVALEALSVAGNHIRDGARNSLRTSQKHRWAQKIALEKRGRLGNRRIYQTKSASNVFGRRMSYDTGETASPDSMAAFITSYLMDKSMTVVIGGRHKKNKQAKYRDGKFAGYMPAIGPVTKESQAILHKLNFGEQNEHHRWKEGRKSIKSFDGKWHGRQFMAKGYFSAQSTINESLTNRLIRNLDKAIKRAEIREQKVA